MFRECVPEEKDTVYDVVMDNYGSVVTLFCDSGARIQGRISYVDPVKQVIQLERPFQDGKPLGVNMMPIDLARILSLNVLNVKPTSEVPQEKSGETTKQKSVEKAFKHVRIFDTSGSSKRCDVDTSEQQNSSSDEASSSSPANTRVSVERSSQPQRRNHNRRQRRALLYGRVQNLPCGIPQLDEPLDDRHLSQKDKSLMQPINFNINEDYDFEKNNELFKIREMGDIGTRPKEKEERVTKNYRHDENIVTDKSRVYSWTDKPDVDIEFTPSRMRIAENGNTMPFLTYDEKLLFLKKAEDYLGTDVFNSLVADRLLAMVFELLMRHDVTARQIILMEMPGTDGGITDFFIRHISNRACKMIVYTERRNCATVPYITYIGDWKELPSGEVEMVIVLGEMTKRTMKSYISTLPKTTLLVTVENVLNVDMPVNILAIAAGTDFKSSGDPRSRRQPLTEGEDYQCVVDIGLPFSWIFGDGAAQLATCFEMQTLVFCLSI